MRDNEYMSKLKRMFSFEDSFDETPAAVSTSANSVESVSFETEHLSSSAKHDDRNHRSKITPAIRFDATISSFR